MASTIPYEDVQTAASQLTQCAVNALSVRYSIKRKKEIYF
jgi:hypothetical protein